MMEKEKKIFKNDFRELKKIIVNKTLCNYGYLLDSLPSKFIDECESIFQDCLKDRSAYERHNQSLAGELENQFLIDLSEEFKEYIFDLCRYYEINSNNYVKANAANKMYISYLEDVKRKKIKNYILPSMEISYLWMNMQKKYEYNPVHDHSGLMSFVIWHKIPYTREEEIEKRPNKFKQNYEPGNGTFMFEYVLNDEVICQPVADSKNYENVIALFPSNLKHTVYPFYSSDEYRVTFSGNIFLKGPGLKKVN